MENQAVNIKEQCITLVDGTRVLASVCKAMKKATEPVIEIEKLLDEASKQLGDMTDDPFYRMEYKEFAGYMDRAITAHTNWLANLKKMVEKQSMVPMQFDSKKCGFGHFYYSMTPKTPEIREIWTKLESKHNKFHSFGKDVRNAVISGDMATAERVYREAEAFSKELIGDFEAMKKIAMSK